ncbi:MAG: sigma-70 family RNA polymerase sigma factor [Candidatus Omnitrophota bacterium]
MDQETGLIERAKNGERAAFDSLVDMHKEKAFALAFSFIGNVEDAKDVLQEAFVKAYVGVINFRGSSKFYTWLYRILVNQCKDFLRKKKAKSGVFLDPLPISEEDGDGVPEAVDPAPLPSQAVLDRETRQMINEAISGLPEKQKAVFMLKHIQGMKLNEIAETVGCSESTAKVHLFRAVRGLRCKLTKSLTI